MTRKGDVVQVPPGACMHPGGSGDRRVERVLKWQGEAGYTLVELSCGCKVKVLTAPYERKKLERPITMDVGETLTVDYHDTHITVHRRDGSTEDVRYA